MVRSKRAPPIRRGPDAIVGSAGYFAGLLVEDEPLVPLLLPEPMLLEPVPVPLDEPRPLEPDVVLLRGTMPAGQSFFWLLDRALELELGLVLELDVVPAALEVPAGTQSLADSEVLGFAVVLGVEVLPLELDCASAGSAMIRASAVVARSCFTPFPPK